MTKLCRQYIYQVKLLLPTVGKAEKKYLATLLTAENLIKRIQIGKYIRGGIITLIIILAVIASIFGITSYRSFQVFKQEAIYFTNTNIGSIPKFV